MNQVGLCHTTMRSNFAMSQEIERTRDLVLVLEPDPERLERFAGTLHRIDPRLQIRCWPDADAMIREVGPLLDSALLVSLGDWLGGEPLVDTHAVPPIVKFLLSHSAAQMVIVHSGDCERSRRMVTALGLAGWPHWRVTPVGNDWIASDWQAAVQLILMACGQMPRIADPFSPRERAYLNLLKWGLLMLRESASACRADLCEIESHHLHNIPTLLGEVNELRHVYYIEQERALYLQRLAKAGATEYLEDAKWRYSEFWNILAVAACVRLSE